MGEGVGMDHGKGAGTTDSAPVGPTGDAGPNKPGGTKTPLRPKQIHHGTSQRCAGGAWSGSSPWLPWCPLRVTALVS